jgi:hypothetical protein
MSSVIIKGDTSGQISLSAPAVAGTNTLTLPTITGTISTLNSGTAVASTSGTSIDFTSIPAGVRRITVMFDAVSTNGSSNWLFQLGDSGGIENTSYVCIGTYLGSGGYGSSNYTAGFGLQVGDAGAAQQGMITFCNLNGNIWTANGYFCGSGTAAGFSYSSVGSKTLSATLDRIRITTVGGTNTFDAGSINILYE